MRTKINNSNGFTLVEQLIVLSVILTILFFSWHNFHSVNVNRTTQHVLNTFEQDIFYIQQHSLLHQRRLTLLFTSSNSYIIYRSSLEPPLVEREFEDHVHFNFDTRRISFNPRGTINEPKTINLSINGQTYEIIFSFGKGRYYVIET
ncbi:competence type IV pilus minor pilin ComGD [Alkalibacillus haloalkaliphilus]|uniref:competence type IV pilus minor pilin ComGD n=1 Tax=Alkalibacillus haloalkaliphilus TaxID=94136 RepID=UPI002936C94C|nr:competence type IV pilus minor pilin ComGD [Alkalibacillus haloalkaliphilus]MDV2580977.1 competence type IV pilus minor pilin ComGD [Alkalibacillus haloalkaliphilus]